KLILVIYRNITGTVAPRTLRIYIVDLSRGWIKGKCTCPSISISNFVYGIDMSFILGHGQIGWIFYSQSFGPITGFARICIKFKDIYPIAFTGLSICAYKKIVIVVLNGSLAVYQGKRPYCNNKCKYSFHL